MTTLIKDARTRYLITDNIIQIIVTNEILVRGKRNAMFWGGNWGSQVRFAVLRECELC